MLVLPDRLLSRTYSTLSCYPELWICCLKTLQPPATSGFMMEFDNRHFWMRLKRLVGSHFANYKEAWEANRLISKGMIHPVLSQVFSLDQTGEAAYQVHHNMHEGKIGVLALAPEQGLGVTNHELREQVAPQLARFRR